VTDRVDLEDLTAGGDLDGVTDDRNLDLASSMLFADLVVVTGEGDTSGRVNLARHRLAHGRLAGTRPLRFDSPGERCGLLGGAVPLRVRRDEHIAVMERHEPVGDRHVDGLTGQPHPDRIQLGRRS